MIRMSKSNLTLIIIIICISCLLIGLCIGCSITPGSIVRTETKVVTEPCEHVNLNEVGLLEQSVTPHCSDCDSPAQRILYDVKNEITYVYTFYWEYRESYAHMLELKDTEILVITSDGTSKIMKGE